MTTEVLVSAPAPEQTAGVPEFDRELTRAAIEIITGLLASGTMRWRRCQVLSSDEAARDILSRLPAPYNRADPSKLRACLVTPSKIPPEKWGLPRWGDYSGSPRDDGEREPLGREGRLSRAVATWAKRPGVAPLLDDEFSKSTAYRDWAAMVKRLAGHKCRLCRRERPGVDLVVHTFAPVATADQLATADTIVVCREHTGAPCLYLVRLAVAERARLEREDVADEGRLF